MTDKKLLKERGRPKGILKFFLRAPLVLYRLGIASILGGRFLKLTHTGRMSGRKHETVLEVVKHDKATGTFCVASGWGEQSIWFRNVMENPAVEVQFKRSKFSARARNLGIDEASAILADYAVRCPRAFEVLTGNILGEKLEPTAVNASVMAEHVPIVALDPSGRGKMRDERIVYAFGYPLFIL
jgi:deazaflavin-dependent oxidoreductase (nitroreductase family)